MCRPLTRCGLRARCRRAAWGRFAELRARRRAGCAQELLKACGRSHTLEVGAPPLQGAARHRNGAPRAAATSRRAPQDVYKAVEAIQRAGVSSWSLDLISGLPHLSPEAWDHSLQEAVRLQPDHISVYDLQVRAACLVPHTAQCRAVTYMASRVLDGVLSAHAAHLTPAGARLGRPGAFCATQVEDGTPFAKWYTPGSQPLPSDEASAAMYRRASEVLGRAGYEHYEVSSYAKPGHRQEPGCHHVGDRAAWQGRACADCRTSYPGPAGIDSGPLTVRPPAGAGTTRCTGQASHSTALAWGRPASWRAGASAGRAPWGRTGGGFRAGEHSRPCQVS